MNHKNNRYQTHDLACATALALSFPLKLEREEGTRAVFIFQRNAELDKTIALFWEGKLLVEPTQYYQKLRMIKSLLYESQ